MANDTKSLVGFVLYEFLQTVCEAVPGMQYVYDEQLSYETGLEAWRKNKQGGESESQLDPFPLFIFKRSVLRYPEDGIGRRGVTTRPCARQGDGSTVWKAVNATIDIEFLIIEPNAEKLECIELEYMQELALADTKQFDVNYGEDLGKMPYYVRYEPLQEKTFSRDQNFFKALTSTASITGWFFSCLGEGPKVIKKINTDFILTTNANGISCSN